MALDGFTDVTGLLRSGVYALLWRGTVVYVGQSKRLLERLYTHRQATARKLPSWHSVRRVQFDEMQFCPCAPDRLDELEREMINRYRPRHNIHHKPPAGVPMLAPIELDLGNGVAWTINRAPEVVGIARRA